MMKIAVLFDTYLNDRKGLFNAIVNRTKCLMSMPGCTVDMICLQGRPAGLNRIIRKALRKHYDKSFQADGLTFRVVWYKRFCLDDVLFNRFRLPPFLFRRWVRRMIDLFKEYDIITAHSARCGETARLVNKYYGTPFFVTWHGTDIHTTPFQSKELKNYIANILASATCNFFVSKALSEIALGFAQGFRYEILYNGVADRFYEYDNQKRAELRNKYGVETNKVVAFAGNVISVKNVLLLPPIFNEVKKLYPGTLSFWIIGDGNMRKAVEDGMKEQNVACAFWGNMDPKVMPEMMNCIDVLVLPSKNESFGLVLVEAMACGANAVGSRVGGIPEVIGEENAFDLNDDFVTNISERIIFFLSNDIKQRVNKRFDWKETVKKEYNIYKQICQDNSER